MTTRLQVSLFSSPERSTEASQGIFVPDLELTNPTPKPESNAIKKRDKRRAWYLQTVLKKSSPDGSTVA